MDHLLKFEIFKVIIVQFLNISNNIKCLLEIVLDDFEKKTSYLIPYFTLLIIGWDE